MWRDTHSPCMFALMVIYYFIVYNHILPGLTSGELLTMCSSYIRYNMLLYSGGTDVACGSIFIYIQYTNHFMVNG